MIGKERAAFFFDRIRFSSSALIRISFSYLNFYWKFSALWGEDSLSIQSDSHQPPNSVKAKSLSNSMPNYLVIVTKSVSE